MLILHTAAVLRTITRKLSTSTRYPLWFWSVYWHAAGRRCSVRWRVGVGFLTAHRVSSLLYIIAIGREPRGLSLATKIRSISERAMMSQRKFHYRITQYSIILLYCFITGVVRRRPRRNS